MQTYVVQRGDTLYGISGQFGVSIEKIKLENNLTSNSITIGQVLKIPTSSTTLLYTVKSGDTLYSIASRYDTTVSELIRLNKLTSNTLSIGQQLRIPIGGNTSDEDNNNSSYVIYTVKVGDNLYSIAKRNGVSVDEIMKLNNLTSNLLSIGQQLKIPTGNGANLDSYQDYTVKAGDNLYSIANAFGMSVDEIMKINNLTSTTLSIGQVLKVKQNYFSDIPLGAKCYGTGYQEPSYLTYTVKRGDNLYTIARKYNVSVDDLMLLNNLTSPNLSIGQVLKIKEVERNVY